MTRKERITKAFANGKPDRVPVSPELWDVIPLKVSGRQFWEAGGTCFSKIPLWQLQLEAYQYFDCEAWIPVEPGISGRQKSMLDINSVFKSSELIITETVYKNSKGSLHEIKHSVFDYDLWPVERPVKNLLKDWPVIEEYFFDDPSKLEYGMIEQAFNMTGDYGICEGIAGNTFFEFLTTFREGGAVQVILDLNDYPEFFLPLQKRYIEHLTAVAEEITRNTSVDAIFVNCGTASLDTISPVIFKKWDIPMLESVGKVAAKHGKIFHYHLHGKGRALLDDIVNAGVNMICPLEQYPMGDFNLKEVKARFGDRLALKGNINPFFPLRGGNPENVEKAVIECIDSAAEGGGFTLSSADGVLGDTPFENIFAMVEAGKRYGRYSTGDTC
jgi:hypothetical protein